MKSLKQIVRTLPIFSKRNPNMRIIDENSLECPFDYEYIFELSSLGEKRRGESLSKYYGLVNRSSLAESLAERLDEDPSPTVSRREKPIIYSKVKTSSKGYRDLDHGYAEYLFEDNTLLSIGRDGAEYSVQQISGDNVLSTYFTVDLYANFLGYYGGLCFVASPMQGAVEIHNTQKDKTVNALPLIKVPMLLSATLYKHPSR
jgi:hypothetical protein